MSEEIERKEGLGLKLLKLLLVILIPLVFILTVATLILKLSGFNVTQEVSQVASGIPVVSHFVKPQAANLAASKSTSGAQNTKDLQKLVSDKEAQINQLNQMISQQQKSITDMKNQIASLKQASKQAVKAAQTKQEQEKASVISSTYQNMDPAKAAAIFEKMSVQAAADDLNLLNDLTKAKIIENLTPDTAAKITPLLAGNPYQSSNSTSSTTTATTTP